MPVPARSAAMMWESASVAARDGPYGVKPLRRIVVSLTEMFQQVVKMRGIAAVHARECVLKEDLHRLRRARRELALRGDYKFGSHEG